MTHTDLEQASQGPAEALGIPETARSSSTEKDSPAPDGAQGGNKEPQRQVHGFVVSLEPSSMTKISCKYNAQRELISL